MPHDSCCHHPAPSSQGFGRSFFWATLLNALFVFAEVFFGLKANSLALLADAWHNLGDVAGLILAWIAWKLAQGGPKGRYTFGLRGGTILAATLNALFLVAATGGIAWEALHRLQAAEPVASAGVISVASLGILINGLTAWMFSKGRDDLNLRAAFLHLAGDAAVSFGVLVGGLAIYLTGQNWIDPILCLGISGFVLWGSWGILRESMRLALHAVPAGIEMDQVRAFLLTLPGVSEVHDLHIWALSTSENALSVHLVMKKGHPGDAFLDQAAEDLLHSFGIGHATLQIEIGNGDTPCRYKPDSVI